MHTACHASTAARACLMCVLHLITAQAGYNLTKYPRRILMLPTLSSCGWAGLASVGCSGSCYTWMNVSVWGGGVCVYAA